MNIQKKSHKDFLISLQSILPENCCPIVITDAGFRNRWFKLILKFGWDFVGRVRHVTKYEATKEGVWEPIKSLYCLATARPKYLYDVVVKQNRTPH